MIKLLKSKFDLLDVHTKEVLKKSSTSTIVKVTGMFLGLLVSIFLGRTLGAGGLGIINLSNQIVSIVVIICLLGMRQVIVKEVAISYEQNNRNRVGNVMYSVYVVNGLFTITASFLLSFFAPWIAKHIFHEPKLSIPLFIAFIALTPQVFSRLFASSLIGYRKIWQSNLADQTLSYGVIFTILLIMNLLDYEITINKVAGIFAIGRIAVMITMGLYWNSLFKFKRGSTFIVDQLIKTASPLFLISLTTIVSGSISFVLLGSFENTKQVGLYSVASQVALLTSFFLIVTNASISPKIAAMYAAKEIKELERMIQQVTKGLALIGIASLTIFLLLGDFILSFWGGDFKEAYYILIILSFGQLFNVGTGAIGPLLIMTGYEKLHSKISIITLIFNIFVSVILIKYFGILGAAIATATSTSLDNSLKVYYANKKVGITTFKLGK